jgi:Helix-turn-helix domain
MKTHRQRSAFVTSHNGTTPKKQERDQLAVKIEAWLRTVTHARLPNGSKLPGNAYKVADDISRNPNVLQRQRGFNRQIFEQTGRLEAWPAVPTIAKATGLSDRTVQRMIKMLCEAGCAEVEGRGGRHQSNRFRAVERVTVLSPFSHPAERVTAVERVTVLTEKGDSPDAERVTALSPELTETHPSGECVADAPPHAPADAEVNAVSQDYAYRPTERSTVVQLRAVSVSVGSPEIGIPRSRTDSVKPKLATVDGRAVHGRETGTKGQHNERSRTNGAAGTGNGSAGKRKRSRGAGRPITTSIPMDWSPSETNLAWATGKGYTDEAIDRMATAFIAHYVGRGTPGANWSAMWVSWVLREAKLPNGERPVVRSAEDEASRKPAGLMWEDRGHYDMSGTGNWVFEGLPADMVYWVDGKKMPIGWQPTAGAANGEQRK